MKNRLLLVSLLASLLCLSYFQPSATKAEAKGTTQPSTNPAADHQAQEADPEFRKGREQARKDLAAGKLGQRLPIPEAFFLEWEVGENKDANLVAYYKAFVADRFGVICEEFIFIPNYTDELKQADGYNGQMLPVIEKRFGKDVLHKAWVEACNTPSEKRDAYLKARAASQKKPAPATQPAH